MKFVNAVPNPDFLTVREAADRSGWSPGYVRSLAACGSLDCDRSTGRILIDVDSLGVLLRARASRRRPQPRLTLVVDNTKR